MRAIKRIIDILVALMLLIMFFPAFLILSTAICIKMGRPIFFLQKRPGKDGTIFIMYKFRTMLNEKNKKGELLSDELRLTTFGKFLRSTSLDELPELINVIKGEMSLVGPRPLLVEYLDLYTPEQMRRHEVRPGITGWAQINGRNAIMWEEKFDLDIWYIDNWNIWLDFKILINTILKVFRRENISHENSATMEKFTGSKSGVRML